MTAERRVRATARVIVLDDRDRMLLMRGHDPAKPERGAWWFTVGGGIDPGETPEQAARRELREETGLVIDELGPVVHQDHVEFELDGIQFEQSQVFFRIRTPGFEPDPAGWDDFEVRTISGFRWWTAEELRATSDELHPAVLPELFA